MNKQEKIFKFVKSINFELKINISPNIINILKVRLLYYYYFKSNIDINLSDFLLLQNYAKFVAENVISGKLSQSKGLIEMNKIVVKSDYDIKYFDFFQLDEDLDYLKYSESTISNYELSKDNKEEFILEEFRLFLEIEKLKVREEIREYSICTKCNHIGKPKLKTEYQLKSPIKYKIWKCEKCNSKEIEHFNSQSGKRKIINKIKNIC